MIIGDFTFSKVSVVDDTSLNYEDKPQSTRTNSDDGIGGLSITGIVVVVIIIVIINWYGL